jgi:hypothetical protein
VTLAYSWGHLQIKSADQEDLPKKPLPCPLGTSSASFSRPPIGQRDAVKDVPRAARLIIALCLD